MAQRLLTLFLVLALGQLSAAPQLQVLISSYLDRYFDTYPSRATEEGRHDLDRQLENLGQQQLDSWLAFNRQFRVALNAAPKPSIDDQIDAELLLRHVDQEIHRLAVLRVPRRDPLFWTGIMANATVFLLMRDDFPQQERVSRSLDRAKNMPRLVEQARIALNATSPAQISPELCRLAAAQAKATGSFYRTQFSDLRPADPSFHLACTRIADALDGFGSYLDGLAKRASGSPRLGAEYAETFRLGTGVTTPVTAILQQAEKDLLRERSEATRFGRTIWSQLMPGGAPAKDVDVLRALFDRVAHDRANSSQELLDNFRHFVDEAETFVRAKQVVTLPEPRTLIIQLSPPFFIGQSVGSVMGTGPYEPQAKTLFNLPRPPATATPAERDSFFRDFNTHFNRMITPHEMMPGHYVEGKYAALNAHRVRAIFSDGVAVEGWGTFSERIMLDLGWGGPLDRLAHMKKQMENISRTIMDIRIHTTNISRDEVIRFVKEEALQNDQFARNMWVRSITTSPQITSYYLGYSGLWDIYEEVRQKGGPEFKPKDYTDRVMKLGPIPVYRVRQIILAH